MVNAQEWLNKTYPNKNEVKKISANKKKLEGSLELSDFNELREVNFHNNELTNLEINNCPKLEKIYCSGSKLVELKVTNCPEVIEVNCYENYLESLDFLSNLNHEKLKEIYIANNNFSSSDLSPFSNFINLEALHIGNSDLKKNLVTTLYFADMNINTERIEKNIYNRFYGSLKPLRNLTRLTNVNIDGTDIDSGLEYLSSNIEKFYCFPEKLPESKVKQIEQELVKFGKGSDIYGLGGPLRSWRDANLGKLRLESFLEKYTELIKEKVSHYDESKSGKKQELEEKIEKAQSYLDKIRVPESRNFINLGRPKKYWGSTEGWKEEPVCERYSFRYDYNDDKSKPVTLDIAKELSDRLNLNPEEKFYVAEEVLERKEIEGAITIESENEIFLQSHLIEEETNKGKIIGVTSGIGVGAAGGAAAGAGLMVLAAPYTFGLSLSLIPAAAGIGAVAGGLGGGATGLMAGTAFDKLSNLEKAKIKEEIKGFLKDYKVMMEEKEKFQERKEHYDNEVREIEAYIENSNNWK